jgi:hypothetical protein
VWFVIAGVLVIAGALLLAVDHGRRTAHQRERRRWAALRGWRFVVSDPVLADRWRHGVIARGGAGMAKDLVVGSLFTPLGRRPVQIFDHEQGGKVSGVVIAVRRRLHGVDLVVELWLPDRPFPQDPGMELLGPVGERYAFVSNMERARPLITPELVANCDALGEDIPVVWMEQDWVLAAGPAGVSPARLERLLRLLDEIADQLDAVAAGPQQPGIEAAKPADTDASRSDTDDGDDRTRR